jgi:hypothetical protein
MKRTMTLLLLLLLSTLPSLAQHSHSYIRSYASKSSAACCSKSTSDIQVHGYTKKNGTVVQPYYRSHENGTQRDNFSTKGNVNPYTGKIGTKQATH